MQNLVRYWCGRLFKRELSGDEKRFYGEWVIFSIVALALLACSLWWQWGTSFGNVIYDRLHRLRGPAPSSEIVVIAIDDFSLDRLGGWPVSRSVYVDLLKKLADTDNRPKAIGFDILFHDATPMDDAFAEQLKRHRAFLAVETPLDEMGFSIKKPRDVLANAALGFGHINIAFETDGFLRGIHLTEAMVPHLALAMSGQASQGFNEQASYRRFNMVNPAVGFPTISLADVLSEHFPVHVLKDKYVLIGSTAPSLGDHYPTIYAGRQSSGMPGVELHANVLNDILREDLISFVSLPAHIALSFWALLSVLVALLVLSPLAELLVTFFVIFCALAVSFFMLVNWNVWFDPGPCVLAIVLVKPAWAWRRMEMIVSFMGERAAQVEQFKRPRRSLAKGLRLQHFTSDTVLQYSRLLDRAIGVMNERVQFLGAIVNDAPNAMLSVDENGAILNANPKMASLVPAGLIRITASVAPFLAYLGVPASDGLQSLVGKDHYVSALDNQASLHYHIFSVIRVSQSDDKFLWILSLVDITEIRQFQNQRDRTLQLLSHDMRTPIASILSLCRQDAVAYENPESSSFKKRRHAEHLLNMMDDFILSIKAQAPKYKLSEVLIDDLMDEAIFQVKDLAVSRRIHIEQVFDAAPQFIWVDQRLFTRMLVNLLVNAIRYGAPDSTLEIELAHDKDGRRHAGAWVHCHIRNRVVDRAHEVDNTAQQGFGLGMDFVRTVIGRHHGRIQFDVDKKPGQLAVVHLMLPMINAPDEAP
ncbi:hypothetical protein B9Z51_14580 [Limnohabitans sp. T6-5]|uniref:CHASE2 domain-containing protein n=1 Tax=Limnohabitans sp. T6-5 TaxID=1100724 RepID=UPI000D33D438|nr:CHASE2 domain-containing protein [Limnohabitans sp. T6-5]PUE07101.1 hypothetical protein B9Z51_14580 [Limnohabitans sp. T6-5]